MASPIYEPSPSEGALRQGEILSNLIQIRVKLDSIGKDIYEGENIIHPFAIVVTQDCDLEQDFKAQHGDAGKHRLLPNILFCEVELADIMRYGENDSALPEDKRARSSLIHTKDWKVIAQNDDERYHFLQEVEKQADLQNEGLPELAVEFKRYFTVPKDEVYYRVGIGEAQRRCRLKKSVVTPKDWTQG